MNDEGLYFEATKEVDDGNQSQALWTKALVLSNGNEKDAKYQYIKLRVEQLVDRDSSKSFDWYIKCIKKYVCFEGRASRKEYWNFALFNIIFSLCLIAGDTVLIKTQSIGFLPMFTTYSILVALPSLGVAVRRLHDIGKSARWLLGFVIIPILFVMYGTIILGDVLTIKDVEQVKTVKVAYQIVFLVYSIVILEFMITAGNKGANKYGINPQEEQR
ncbi:MAG: DUF805 domain-containing protein [Methylophagaceae bacterium]